MSDNDDHVHDRQLRRSAAPVPEKPDTVEVPRELIGQTITLLLAAPASQVYHLVQAWEAAVPDLLSRT